MVLTIVLVAFQIFLSTVAGTARQRAILHENTAAIESAREMLEILRDEPFESIFALYNEDPTDDPGGAGTAPGATFDVRRLDAFVRSGSSALGQIVFPTSSKEKKDHVEQKLREDYEDRSMGMPRDLDGDGKIDDKDHVDDYIMLPVAVYVTWEAMTGPREVCLNTILADYRW